jgi:hypothetical protein
MFDKILFETTIFETERTDIKMGGCFIGRWVGGYIQGLKGVGSNMDRNKVGIWGRRRDRVGGERG